MSDLFVIFWTFAVFTSIFWYAFLLFYIGAKAGREIRQMTQTLESRQDPEKKS